MRKEFEGLFKRYPDFLEATINLLDRRPVSVCENGNPEDRRRGVWPEKKYTAFEEFWEAAQYPTLPFSTALNHVLSGGLMPLVGSYKCERIITNDADYTYEKHYRSSHKCGIKPFITHKMRKNNGHLKFPYVMLYAYDVIGKINPQWTSGYTFIGCFSNLENEKKEALEQSIKLLHSKNDLVAICKMFQKAKEMQTRTSIIEHRILRHNQPTSLKKSVIYWTTEPLRTVKNKATSLYYKWKFRKFIP